jgi:hypothetical protein
VRSEQFRKESRKSYPQITQITQGGEGSEPQEPQLKINQSPPGRAADLECGGKRQRDTALDHPKRRRRFTLPAHSNLALSPTPRTNPVATAPGTDLIAPQAWTRLNAGVRFAR